MSAQAQQGVVDADAEVDGQDAGGLVDFGAVQVGAVAYSRGQGVGRGVQKQVQGDAGEAGDVLALAGGQGARGGAVAGEDAGRDDTDAGLNSLAPAGRKR
ncbi:hypothetical protein ACFYZ9_40030 [Streptomyces sp. NPDC001691]|uniref:hypothetical protein n=1 Tax=Streptomyces sp. NPDC001691 TaxID=3364600 RepID=UPI0036AEA065